MNYKIIFNDSRKYNNVYNNSIKTNVSLKPKIFCAESIEPKQRKAELQNHYNKNFIKGSKETPSPTCSFCNYCCQVGHISLECPLRKPTSSSNVMWVRKDRNIASCSTSKLEVPKSH